MNLTNSNKIPGHPAGTTQIIPGAGTGARAPHGSWTGWGMAGCIAMLGIVGWRRIWYRMYFVYTFSKFNISISLWAKINCQVRTTKKRSMSCCCSLQWFFFSILRSLSLWTLPCRSCGPNRGHSDDVFWSAWQASPSWWELSWDNFVFWHFLFPVVCTKSYSKHRCMLASRCT